ncbi:DUF6232 family protein [Streptomyces sp. NPDC001744]|uniref:DUF6232 family protein n=1 Tax=Streptomyces sp. NPDC001744 TaxID=3364606 RepID=UPI00369226ED
MPTREGNLVLRVSRRILWVGAAAIPLSSITRVEPYKIKPNRASAFFHFLGWGVAAFVAHGLINAGNEAVNGPLLAVFLIVPVFFLLKALFEQAKPALAVESAGGSTAVVTLPSMDDLREIAGRIVYAIEHPEAEFTAVVQQFSNTNNYGPVVNMNGGRNNRGISL